MAARGDIVHEGWLTKSPPSKRLWKLKWRRRWFSLRHSKDMPGQYFLDYYIDKKSQKPKGCIDLDLCDQVDAGLRMQRRNSEDCTVFSIRTQSRVYHLQADCVAEMEKWVEVICSACNFKSINDEKYFTRYSECPSGSPTVSGPYIPISECYTGPISGSRLNVELLTYNNIPNQNDRENGAIRKDSNANDTDRLMNGINDQRRTHTAAENSSRRYSLNDCVVSHNRTSAPPRPPKPSHLIAETAHKDTFVGPRIHEPTELAAARSSSDVKMTLPDMLHEIPLTSHHRQIGFSNGAHGIWRSSRDPDQSTSEGYYLFNAPAVNRELKPGRSRDAKGMYLECENKYSNPSEDLRPRLQYLDLDLDSNKSSVTHLKSRSADDTCTVYKTVDFLKTEALNSTRIDTEECRRKEISLHKEQFLKVPLKLNKK